MKDSSHRTCINIGCDTITQSHLMPFRKSNDWDLYVVKESSAPDSLLTLEQIRQNENRLINDHLFIYSLILHPWLYNAKRPYPDLSSKKFLDFTLLCPPNNSYLYKIHDMTQRDMENNFALCQCTNGSVLSATTKQVSREWENGSINQQQGMFSIDFFFSYLAIFTAGPFGLTNFIITE